MQRPDQLPPYAHIPGVNPRHPEGWFDPISDTAQAGMSVAALTECAAFQSGLRYLKAEYYWEAHEVFEPVWMALSPGDEKQVLQALIQLANGKLKLQMGRPKAALRLCEIVEGLLADLSGNTVMGVSIADLRLDVGWLREAAKSEI